MGLRCIASGLTKYQYECQTGRGTHEIRDLPKDGILGVLWIEALIEL